MGQCRLPSIATCIYYFLPFLINMESFYITIRYSLNQTILVPCNSPPEIVYEFPPYISSLKDRTLLKTKYALYVMYFLKMSYYNHQGIGLSI